MAAIKYRVPYEVAVNALDLASGKKISNIYYYQNGIATGPAPAYGADVAGSSSATLLANLKAQYDISVPTILSHNYQMVNLVMRAIVGKQYRTPFQVISAMTTGGPVTTISSMFPHGLHSGDAVYIQGVTSPPLINGVWLATVVDSTTFTVPFTTGLTWSSDGQFQLATGAYQFAYADKQTIVDTTVGTVAGDALPLFSSASVRRNNEGVGKSFRSRVSLGPIAESYSVDGGLTGASITAINAAMLSWLTAGGQPNGGTDVGAGLSYQVVVSKKIASTLPLVFPNADNWVKGGIAYAVQRNTGSMVRRKPRLTSIIT